MLFCSLLILAHHVMNCIMILCIEDIEIVILYVTIVNVAESIA